MSDLFVEPPVGVDAHHCPDEQVFEEYWLGLLGDHAAYTLLDEVSRCEVCRHRNITIRKQVESIRRGLIVLGTAERMERRMRDSRRAKMSLAPLGRQQGQESGPGEAPVLRARTAGGGA